MKKVLLVTRPIAPPWDEASKNFAYFIAKNIQGTEINLMTKGILAELPPSVKQNPVYTTAEIAEFNLEQKVRSLFFQFKSRGKFDINHYFFTPTRLNSFLIKNLLTSKKTKIIQTIATLREDLWSDSDLKNLLFGDLIITYSEHAKNKLASLGFKNATRIYPGIDIEKYVPTTKDMRTLSAFGLSASDYVIMYPGEYVRLGATDDIIATLPDLFEKIPNAKFVFACRVKNEQDAQKKEAVIELLKQNGILEKVVFSDTFADMPKLFNLADVIVFPVRDMFGKFDVPLVVIEAMACEKPIIISDLPILQEFSNAGNSVIIKTGDFQQFVSANVELFQNESRREGLGKAARKYAVENFDIRNVAKQYEEVYKNL